MNCVVPENITGTTLLFFQTRETRNADVEYYKIQEKTVFNGVQITPLELNLGYPLCFKLFFFILFYINLE